MKPDEKLNFVLILVNAFFKVLCFPDELTILTTIKTNKLTVLRKNFS